VGGGGVVCWSSPVGQVSFLGGVYQATNVGRRNKCARDKSLDSRKKILRIRDS